MLRAQRSDCSTRMFLDSRYVMPASRRGFYRRKSQGGGHTEGTHVIQYKALKVLSFLVWDLPKEKLDRHLRFVGGGADALGRGWG